MKVLICDDSELIRDRIVEQLNPIYGLDISEQADTVADSIFKINKHCPDIAIVDIRFPDGTGMEIVAFIKKNCPATTVLVLTNYPNSQYKKKCFELGADFFLDKSSEFEQVAEICSELTNRSRNSPHLKLSLEKME